MTSLTDNGERWEVRVSATSTDEVGRLGDQLRTEISQSVSDAVQLPQVGDAPDDSRALADSDLGLILISMSPFVAEQVVAAVRLWVARLKKRHVLGEEDFAGRAIDDAATEVVIEEGDLKVTIRRRSS